MSVLLFGLFITKFLPEPLRFYTSFLLSQVTFWLLGLEIYWLFILDKNVNSAARLCANADIDVLIQVAPLIQLAAEELRTITELYIEIFNIFISFDKSQLYTSQIIPGKILSRTLNPIHYLESSARRRLSWFNRYTQ